MMDFYAVLDQVIALLKQRGRASYRALKVQFTLDDASLEALKEEILYVHPVVDDEGKGLIWTGEIESTQAVASQPTQTPQQPTTQETQPTHDSPLESRSPEAERR
jgi:hypothetical protein